MTADMELTLRDSITIPEDVLIRELDGEAVLLNLESGVYFGLNGVATRMWQLMAERHSLAAVLDTLAGEYDADQRVLEADLLELGRQLCANGLARVSASTTK
jgi:Coenzyme PQQ synthesis protein D (PqqD)